ncbi:MAG: YCF48-related protein [Ignavibacteria bacterium]
MKRISSLSVILVTFIFINTVHSQWINSYTFNPAQSLQVIKFYDQNTGYCSAPVYGSQYNIHKTTNAGLNWIDQTAGYNGTRFMGIWIVSPDTVYICGNFGIIIKTVNGGNNWTTLTQIDSTAQYWGIQFLNSNTGFICGSYGKVLKTTNSGLNWNLNYSAPNQNFLSYIDFINANTGYIAGSGVVLKTTDAGNGWIQQTPAFVNFEVMNQIQFFNELTGYGVSNTSNGRFFKTTNGGNNWDITSISPNGALMGEYFMNANTGYACGWNGVIIYTTDAGSTWTTQSSGLSEILTSVYFTTSLTGYITTWYGHVLKTTNGGLSFINKISSEVPSDFMLYQNYPNPFNPSTKIEFLLPLTKGVGGMDNNVLLSVFDITGKQVATLINESLTSGKYEVTFNANGLSSGIYFYKLTTGSFSETKRMILLK